jgi:hypothetical protein
MCGTSISSSRTLRPTGIVLMYPFNVGADLTGFSLDNIASSDPDGDLTASLLDAPGELHARVVRHVVGCGSVDERRAAGDFE